MVQITQDTSLNAQTTCRCHRWLEVEASRAAAAAEYDELTSWMLVVAVV